MRKTIFLSFIIICSICIISCNSSKNISSDLSQTPVSISKLTQSYVELYKEIAIKEMKRTGIPASITLAQGILESNYGRSELAIKAKNHFGIKCHSSWNGAKVYHDDDKSNECFRKYNLPAESFKDHSDFITSGSRYKFLFNYKSTDYKSWAHGLKKAGYATDSHYPQKIIRLIEENQLHFYDSGKNFPKENQKENQKEKSEPKEAVDIEKPKPFNEKIDKNGINNGVRFVIATENDTYKSIASQFEIQVSELLRYNDLPKNAKIFSEQRIYIEPKKQFASTEFKSHQVTNGETMYTIAQKYAMRLDVLYKINNLKRGEKLTVGQKLKLQDKKTLADSEKNKFEFDY